MCYRDVQACPFFHLLLAFGPATSSCKIRMSVFSLKGRGSYLVSKIQFCLTCLCDIGQHKLIAEINWIPLFSPYSSGTLVFGLLCFSQALKSIGERHPVPLISVILFHNKKMIKHFLQCLPWCYLYEWHNKNKMPQSFKWHTQSHFDRIQTTKEKRAAGGCTTGICLWHCLMHLRHLCVSFSFFLYFSFSPVTFNLFSRPQ